jgi:hypothetical protein
MKGFINLTNEGNENAIRRGSRVPDGAVNMAWVKAPPLNPKTNIVMLDTSGMTPENAGGGSDRCGIYLANQMGVLGRIVGRDPEGRPIWDHVIKDEYPAIGDVFSVDEDFSVIPGSEYTDDDILPYVHVSRFFHIDKLGLSNNDLVRKIRGLDVKVVDDQGIEYPKYRIVLLSASGVKNQESVDNIGSTAVGYDKAEGGAYRVWVYIDTKNAENLRLQYNKIELTPEGYFKNQNINHSEALNPQPYYKYIPEETDVIDPGNRRKRWFSSKPVNVKEHILGMTVPEVDGYKVWVPKRAVADTRKFQMFRWRVACKFTETIKVDPSRSGKSIHVGMVTIGNETRPAFPFAFYNMELSDYNAGQISFSNPYQENRTKSNGTKLTKKDAEYWAVPFDTVTDDDLRNFDLLVWCPRSGDFDFAPYMGKINNFIHNMGGTVMVDGGEFSRPIHLADTVVSSTRNSWTGDVTSSAPSPNPSVLPSTFQPADGFPSQNIVLDGLARLGGWSFNDGGETFSTIHPEVTTNRTGPDTYTAEIGCITERDPATWGDLITGMTPDIPSVPYPVLSILDRPEGVRGNLVVSTLGLPQHVGSLWDNVTGYLLDQNVGDTVYTPPSNKNYQRLVSGFTPEGMTKLLYNLTLLATKGTIIDKRDEKTFTSVWEGYSKWKSSWTINNEDNVLSEDEVRRYDFMQGPISLNDPTSTWQRKLGNTSCKDLIDAELTDLDKVRSKEAVREYRIEVTNPRVETTPLLTDDSIPYAWTDVYTPSFTVPIELAPYVVEEEPSIGEYDSVSFSSKIYPPKPYGLQIDVKSISTEQLFNTTKLKWLATASAEETITIKSAINWAIDQGRSISWWTSYFPPDYGHVQPWGLDTYQSANYYSEGYAPICPVYSHIGLWDRLEPGSSGESVKFLQDMLNRMHDLGYYLWPAERDEPFGFYPAIGLNRIGGNINQNVRGLAVTGYYDYNTYACVLSLQNQFYAYWHDGIVDAETWGILANQCLRMDAAFGGRSPTNPNDYTRFYDLPRLFADRPNFSDGRTDTLFARRSPTYNSPAYVWDMFQFTMGAQHDIVGASVWPWTEGGSGQVIIDGFDVFNMRGPDPRIGPGNISFIGNGSMLGLDRFRSGELRWKPRWRVKDGEECYIPIAPERGDTVVVMIGQDQPSIGSSKALGVRDLQVWVQNRVTQAIQLGDSGIVEVKTGEDKVVNLVPHGSITGSVSKIHWNNWEINTMDETGLINGTPIGDLIDVRFDVDQVGNKRLIFRNLQVDNLAEANFKSGPVMAPANVAQRFDANAPNNIWYGMTEDGKVSPHQETGYVGKSEGIKLLCTKEGKPYGFPTFPTELGDHEHQRHYLDLTLTSLGSDISVRYGFYDNKAKEFIYTTEGIPSMSYIEWMTRGPDNVYVAVMSNYESQSLDPIPEATDAPLLPTRWAYPVYGVCSSPGSRIKMEPMPDNLGYADIWGIPIKTGSFTRVLKLPSIVNSKLTTWVKNYAGTEVKAFYSVPEASLAGWSKIYGRPYSDVVDEHPLVLDDNTIQVRQPPILMQGDPTVYASNADPVRPVIRIYTRPDQLTEWEEIGFSGIDEFHAAEGIVKLKDPLSTADSNLVKVSYTSALPLYLFKKSGSSHLNLNPYTYDAGALIGKSIYIYILPEYVRDHLGNTISASVRTSTLKFTTDPAIFDTSNPLYDPLAVQLGIVFVTTALDIDQLGIIDTRRRGGGATDTAILEELEHVITDASSYWDLGYGSGMTYQKGGFIIIRLPEQLKIQFPNKQDIMDIIERNITAGVAYRIETLEGNEW